VADTTDPRGASDPGAEWQAWHRWVEARLASLTPARRAHCERVGELAALLCAPFGEDAVRAARLAGRAHDIARELSPAAWRREAERLGLTVGAEERAAPVLLHGPVAAGWMALAGVGTPSARDAVRFHTTAAPHLDVVGQAVFVADGTEPARAFAEAAALRRLAVHNLEAGYRAVLDASVRYLDSRGLAPHPLTLAVLGTSPGADRATARGGDD
jgi:predicted HD superfamily hydrolase involved in NAD metabolism